MSWLDQLIPASWQPAGGQPLFFSVRDSDIASGRKIALHDYPFRDQPWPEDIGKKGRGYTVQGFLVGDDCYQQEQAFIAAAETAGPGIFVHPTLGPRNVTLLDFTSGQSMEAGRTVTLNFRFIEGGNPLYPTDTTSTQNDVQTKAGTANSAANQDYAAQILNSTPPDQSVSIANQDGSITTYGPEFQVPAAHGMVQT